MKRPRLCKDRVFNPDAKKKQADKWVLTLLHRQEPINLRATVSITYYMPIPRTKKKTNDGDIHHSKPDLDNLIKHTLDVITGIIITDDALIHTIMAKKVYSDNPRTQLHITFEN